MKRIIAAIIFVCAIFAHNAFAQTQDNAQTSAIKRIQIPINNSRYYIVFYKDTKPDDVPQEVYDGLWEVQKEVIDNFTYDYDVLRGRKRSPYSGWGMPTLEDYYTHGSGVCEDYSNFFILLAREKRLTENLYKVSGKRGSSGHAWLEYRTEENRYIIDPTWSDDYSITDRQARQKFRESPAYGRRAFFITYEEDKIIFRKHQSYNHSSYTGKRSTPLWEKNSNEAGDQEDL